MARYIDADILIKNIAKIEDLRTLSTKTIGEAISNTPTADVVEVVRCKDCKYSFKSHIQPKYLEKQYLCRMNDEYQKAEHFCGYGNRK